MAIAITSIKFKNYKALGDYSVSLQSLNILVGPNNCGKSTILSAFRILDYALRIANARSAQRIYSSEGYPTYGHRLSENNMPSTLENVHTNYSDIDSRIEFKLSNKNTLILFFPHGGGCYLYWKTSGKPVSTPTAFRKHFPITIQVIPILGPIEQEEILVGDEAVRRAVGTPRASRHFRNYWYKNPDGFSEFKKLIEKTWIGMSIKTPEIVDRMASRLVMFCTEDRMDRELFWAGFGFQIWCQLLTHISRSSYSDLLIIDEPEVYLHPDVQRQLLGILRDVYPDIILATHSTEILSEADPSEILLIDKTKSSAARLKDVGGVQQALDSLGSVQNITLTHLARTRKILFVEGINDFKIIRRFAKLTGFNELASGSGLTALESGGFSSWERIKALSWGMKHTLGSDIYIGAIYDRDYWSDEQIAQMQINLDSDLFLAHIHKRKEIENYLLIPAILARAIDRSILDRERRSGVPLDKRDESIEEILDKLTSKHKTIIQGQYIGKHIEYHKPFGKDNATLSSEAINRFEERWKSLDLRMEIVAGKVVLKALRAYVNEKWVISLTDIKIIDEFRVNEIPSDFMRLLNSLNKYRLHVTPS